MNKKLSFLLVFLLFYQTIASSLVFSAENDAEELEQSIVTAVTITDDEGNVLNIADIPTASPENIQVDWSVKDIDVTEGTTESFTIPSGLYLEKEQTGSLTYEEIEVGTFQASIDGNVELIFYKEVEEHANANGTFLLKASAVTESDQPEEPSEPEDKEPVENEEKPLDKKNRSASEEQEEETTQPKKDQTVQSSFTKTEIKENLITDFELTLRDGSPLPDPLPHPSEELELKVHYDFALPNDHEYAAGSTFTFQLPEQLTVYNMVTGELGDYGQYEVTTDGTVTFTFNKNIELKSDITGYLEVYSVIDKYLEGGTEQTIKVPIREDEVKEIDLHFESKVGSSIDKRGTPNQSYNATSIEWEIDFNKDQKFLEDAVLSDPISPEANQKFVPGSIKIYSLDVQLDGSVIQGEEITDHSFGDEFPLNFSDIDRDAYRVVFETEITDEEAVQYTNEAKLTWKDDSLSADATVTINRGKALEKRAAHYDPKTQTITWEVKYNYNEKYISKEQAYLIDELSDNQVLIEDSFTVVEVEIDPQSGAVKSEIPFNDYTITDREDDLNGFKFQFKKDIDKAYKITYKTKANERIYDVENVENKIEANGKTESGNQWIRQQIFDKFHLDHTTDYNEKTTQWGIRINQDSHPMRNVVLTDELPEGLELIDYQVLYYDGENDESRELNDGEHFDHTYNIETGEMAFDFSNGPLNPVNHEIYIVYTTKFDYNKIGEGKTSFTNKAKLSWIAEGENEPREKTDSDTFYPNDLTKLNGAKGGSYNAKTKEVTWQVGVNYNYRNIEEAIVEDIIQGNQNLDISSLKVYKMNIDKDGSWTTVGEPLVEDTDYTVEVSETEDGQPKVRVNLGEIDSAYRIEFTTKLDDELIVKEYNNRAILIDGDTEFPLHAKVSVNNGGDYTSKDAIQDPQNEQILQWTVNINNTQSTISNVKLVDKPSANQILLKDSFELYGSLVNENGDVTKNPDDLLVEGKDYSLEFKKDEEGKAYFELTFLDEIDRPYVLDYRTFLMAGHGEKVNNNANLTGEQITTEKTDSQKEVTVRYSGGDGGASGKVGKLEIHKIDARSKEALEGAEFTLFDKAGEIVLFSATTDQDGKIIFDNLRFGDYVLKETKVPEGYISNYTDGQTITINKDVNETNEWNVVTIENQPIMYEVQLTKLDEETNQTLEGATFKLLQKVKDSFETIRQGITTDKNGVILVTDLEPGDYQFVETKAPNGYLLNEEPITFTIREEATEVVKVTAKNKAIETTSISGEKTWKDGNSPNRPEMIVVDLLQDGEVWKTTEVTANDQWQFHFPNLPKTDALGNAYEYEVKERAVEGYQSTVDGFDITNLRVGTTAVTGSKIWKDDNAEDRPSTITVDLLQNGKVIDTKEVTAKDHWKFSFTDLAKFDENGVAYVYTVQEKSVNGYRTTVDGYNITNLRVGKTEVVGSKTWKDGNAEARPAVITVELLQNGEVIDTKEVTAADDWKYSFTDLAKYDENGVVYKYTVQEKPVEGYQTTVNGFNITNVRVGETEVVGSKTWKDENAEARPSSIKVNLLQNGVVIQTTEVTAKDNWEYSFTDLDQYDENGVAYDYKVKEQGVPGYKSEVNGYDITNTRSEKVSVEVTKGWLDDGATDRPTSIQVTLQQNGKEFETVELTEADGWEHTFANLEAYDENGIAYVYTVTEEPVKGYETRIDGYDITNVRVGKTEVVGTKTWKDDNAEDRPTSITVELLQNGEVIDTKEVTEEDEWKYSFTDLAKYDENGVAYEYTVQEQPVEGYQATVDGYDITNVRVGTTEAVGTKTWKDDNAEDRPTSITVELLQNGEVIETTEVTAEDEWKYSFIDLAKYDENGVAYEYTVQEQPVEGYQATVDGYDITNVRVGTTEVIGTKTWKDDNAEDRPTSITVELLQSGEVIDTTEVTEEDEWKYSFTDLAKYDENGVAYEYVVQEQPVEGYETTINGYEIINTLLPISTEEENTDEVTPDANDNQNTTTDEEFGSSQKGSQEKGAVSEESSLPNTATSIFNIIAYGIGVLIVGVVILLVYRKKEQS